MARHTPLTSLKQISEINLTPLMDLTFILLITFIITFPLIEQGIPIQLPEATASTLEPDRATAITIDERSRYYLDDIPMTLADLEREVQQLSSDPSVTVMVRADERVPYAAVVKVLRLLHGAGVTRMALVTQEA